MPHAQEEMIPDAKPIEETEFYSPIPAADIPSFTDIFPDLHLEPL